MQLFWSEDDVDEWVARSGHSKGAVFGVEQLWPLAQRWYDDRRELEWRRKSARERQAILDDVGLVGPFWQVGSR